MLVLPVSAAKFCGCCWRGDPVHPVLKVRKIHTWLTQNSRALTCSSLTENPYIKSFKS
jgi:hypothetical protein